jgi:hypothetical protein
MYDFHKVKSPSGAIQFQNANFKRNSIESLYRVTRKVGSGVSSFDADECNINLLAQELDKTTQRINELKNSILSAQTQNKNLIETNKEQICNVVFLKNESDLKLQKLLFIFHILIANYLPELMNFFKEVCFRFQLAKSNDNAFADRSSMLNCEYLINVCKQFSYDRKTNEKLLNKLLLFFVDYLKKKDQNSDFPFDIALSLKELVNQVTFNENRKCSNLSDYHGAKESDDPEILSKDDKSYIHLDDYQLDMKSENFCDLDVSQVFSYSFSVKKISVHEVGQKKCSLLTNTTPYKIMQTSPSFPTASLE